MIALVMTVCLLAAPENCHEERLLLDMPKMACDVLAQEIIAEWIGDHPAYLRRGGWRCEPPFLKRKI